MWAKALPSLSFSRRPPEATETAAVLLVLCTLPFWLHRTNFVSLAVAMCITATAVYGLELLYTQVGNLSLAHAALQGVGAYTAAITLRDLGVTFWLALPLAAAVAAVFAGVIGLPTARIRGHYFVILTFAFGGFMVIAANNGGSFTGGPDGILNLKPIPKIFGWAPSITQVSRWYVLSLVFLVLAIAANRLIRITTFARTCRAIRENEVLARSLGIDVSRYRVSLFMISGAFAGVSGVLYFAYFSQIGPGEFGITPSVQMVLMLMIGGTGRMIGPLVGVALVLFLPEVIHLDPVDAQIGYGLVLIAVILILPEGIVPTAARLLQPRRLPDLARRGPESPAQPMADQ